MLRKELIACNSSGLIPGPGETEDEFFRRKSYCISLKDFIFNKLGNEIPFVSKENLFSNTLSHPLYGIKPDWVPLFFSNYQLFFWQGGCAWIFQIDDESPTSAMLQLRKSLGSHTKYLGIYDRDEMITHELSHVGRMMFQEPKFEEVLAYQSSPFWFRRFFGPLFQFSWESFLFIFLLLIGTFFMTMTSFLLPIGYLTFLLMRLLKKQWALEKCKNNTESILQNPKDVLPFIYRLTDKEIISFSHWSTPKIKQYIQEQRKDSFRWSFLYTCYFKDVDDNGDVGAKAPTELSREWPQSGHSLPF